MSYSSFGAAVSEVEIDVLTGEKLVLQSDIHFDCGRSLNPAVDMGQVNSCFAHTQGDTVRSFQNRQFKALVCASPFQKLIILHRRGYHEDLCRTLSLQMDLPILVLILACHLRPKPSKLE